MRPVCEYASVALSPYMQKDIICLQSIHCRAARFVCSDYRLNGSVTARVSNLGWVDLELRRRIADLTMFLKIRTGNVRISFLNDLRAVASHYCTCAFMQHPFQFQHFLSNFNAHTFSFFCQNCQTGVQFGMLGPLLL